MYVQIVCPFFNWMFFSYRLSSSFCILDIIKKASNNKYCRRYGKKETTNKRKNHPIKWEKYLQMKYPRRDCIESVDRVCYIWSLLCWDRSPLNPFCWQLFCFTINSCWILSEAFSASVDNHMLFSSILLMWYPQHMDPCSSTLLSYNSNSIGDTSLLFYPTSFPRWHVIISLATFSKGL